MENCVFFEGAPPELRSKIQSQSKLLEFKRGDYVYRQGDDPKGLYLVNSGLVGFMVTASKSGKEHLLRFFKPNQFFGHRALFSTSPYHGSTVILEATQISFVPKDVFLTFTSQYPEVLQTVVRVLSTELKNSEIQRVMVLENEILARVGQTLIYLLDLYPDHNWTRQEIANFCASTAPTVIRTMAQLETMGLVRQNGRKIEILDRQGLIALQED